jgi:thiol:disulfide interchange protein DsbD
VAFSIPVRMEGGPEPADEVQEQMEAQAAKPPEGTGGSGEGGSADASSPSEADSTSAAGSDVLSRFQSWLFSFGFIGVIVAGFLGGFVLNLMPCVLPVISLKVLSFVRQAHEHRLRIFLLTLTYSAGIMTFYLVLAALLFGSGIGWGELFQRPHFVIGMAAVVLAFSLSLFGVFAVFTPRVINDLGQRAEGEGFASAFGTGVLATLLGTACTAPLLSAAIGYASRLGPLLGTIIFVSVGLGMAFPFIVLGAKPAWVRFVPRPGPWMGTFEAIMGFLLLATVIWLLNPLRTQIGDFGLLLSLIFLMSVGIAVWIKGKIEFGAPTTRKLKLYGTAIVIAIAGWLIPFRAFATIRELQAEQAAERLLAMDGEDMRQFRAELERYVAQHSGGGEVKLALVHEWLDGGYYKLDWEDGIPWQHYSPQRVRKAVERGNTVFVDYTASWCASCKTNLKTSINVDDTIRAMRQLNVVPFEADYSSFDPQITKDLEQFGRAGVPLYLVYKPGDPKNPQVLPEFLTPSIVVDALNRAGPSNVVRPVADEDATKVARVNP